MRKDYLNVQSKPEGGLSLASHQSRGPKAPGAEVLRRGDTTFNRRFFETSLRRIPGGSFEAEKSMVIAVKAGKNEYVGGISRISGTKSVSPEWGRFC
jgi:hypothetical protein